MNKIPYGRQHITQEDIDAVVEVLRSDFLTQGPKIAEFESSFAEYIGSDYAVAVSNGTAALHLSALALGVDSSSKVITTPITFVASANCVRYCGGKTEFVDVDADTILIDIDAIRVKLEHAPSGTYQGIIAVDFAGYPVNMEALRELADAHHLWILEDACHAPGAWFLDSAGVPRQCGNCRFADLAVFSFHPVKHITTGEGGMITTNRKDLYDALIMLRTHGITKRPELMQQDADGGWTYDMLMLGFNYRVTDFQCALGITQLSSAELRLKRRQELAKNYDNAFVDSPVQFISPPDTVGHAYHLYVVQVNNRKELYDHLRSHCIYAQVHYIPIHFLTYHCQAGTIRGEYPVAERYYEKCLSLPLYPTLTDDEQQFVIEKVLEAAK